MLSRFNEQQTKAYSESIRSITLKTKDIIKRNNEKIPPFLRHEMPLFIERLHELTSLIFAEENTDPTIVQPRFQAMAKNLLEEELPTRLKLGVNTRIPHYQRPYSRNRRDADPGDMYQRHKFAPLERKTPPIPSDCWEEAQRVLLEEVIPQMIEEHNTRGIEVAVYHAVHQEPQDQLSLQLRALHEEEEALLIDFKAVAESTALPEGISQALAIPLFTRISDAFLATPPIPDVDRSLSDSVAENLRTLRLSLPEIGDAAFPPSESVADNIRSIASLLNLRDLRYLRGRVNNVLDTALPPGFPENSYDANKQGLDDTFLPSHTTWNTIFKYAGNDPKRGSFTVIFPLEITPARASSFFTRIHAYPTRDQDPPSASFLAGYPPNVTFNKYTQDGPPPGLDAHQAYYFKRQLGSLGSTATVSYPRDTADGAEMNVKCRILHMLHTMDTDMTGHPTLSSWSNPEHYGPIGIYAPPGNGESAISLFYRQGIDTRGDQRPWEERTELNTALTSHASE